MFTGLIETTGSVRGVEPVGGGVRLSVGAPPWTPAPGVGESICVHGCCLTVARAAAGEGRLDFDVVPETMRCTTLGGLRVGDRVHLERSATPATLLSGHLVQGHVDGVGAVERVEAGTEYRVAVRVPGPLMEFMAPKGSVCVDGVSLTLAAVDAAGGVFEVALIPTTLEKTRLGSLRAGDRCNVEADVIAKTVVHWLRTHVLGSPASGRA